MGQTGYTEYTEARHTSSNFWWMNGYFSKQMGERNGVARGKLVGKGIAFLENCNVTVSATWRGEGHSLRGRLEPECEEHCIPFHEASVLTYRYTFTGLKTILTSLLTFSFSKQNTLHSSNCPLGAVVSGWVIILVVTPGCQGPNVVPILLRHSKSVPADAGPLTQHFLGFECYRQQQMPKIIKQP